MQQVVGWAALASAATLFFFCCAGVAKAFLALGAIGLVGFLALGAWWFTLEMIRWNDESELNKERDGIRKVVIVEFERRKAAWQGAIDRLTALETQWEQAAAQFQKGFSDTRMRLEALRRTYLDLRNQQDIEYRALALNAEAYQKKAFLENKYLCDHKVSGIGESRQTVLASYGIETAADISSEEIDKVPGFGPALTANLLEWRVLMEREFRFDPKTGIPAEAVRALEIKYFQLRQLREGELQQGPSQLKIYSSQADQHLAVIMKQIESAVLVLTKAEVDVSVIDVQSLGVTNGVLRA
ncbi:hypothetical protein AYO40_03110 [Planctomycetaceae bacterium SCGC AG-212-D15]|nr:hypothetical protein AYO40_03110 [Planctomycetaceae bacterium SCGC AG-212-D15]